MPPSPICFSTTYWKTTMNSMTNWCLKLIKFKVCICNISYSEASIVGDDQLTPYAALYRLAQSERMADLVRFEHVDIWSESNAEITFTKSSKLTTILLHLSDCRMSNEYYTPPRKSDSDNPVTTEKIRACMKTSFDILSRTEKLPVMKI